MYKRQGLVCIGKYSQEDIETYKKICSNVIFLDMNIDPIHECCILLDFKNAVKDVVSYLSQKHPSIAYLGGKEIIHDLSLIHISMCIRDSSYLSYDTFLYDNILLR